MPKTTQDRTAEEAGAAGNTAALAREGATDLAKAHDSAVEEYGEGSEHTGSRTRRSSTASRRSATTGSRRPRRGRRTHGRAAEARRPPAAPLRGVDANASRRHLYDIARKLDIHGRSTMNKGELVDAIEKENRRRSAAARS